MIHNYDKLQMKKRVALVKLAGKSQIKEVDEEDLEVSAELPVNLKHTEGIINQKLEQLEKLIVHKDVDMISDFNSVNEESEDDDLHGAFEHFAKRSGFQL